MCRINSKLIDMAGNSHVSPVETCTLAQASQLGTVLPLRGHLAVITPRKSKVTGSE
jgi:hypothetical protein